MNHEQECLRKFHDKFSLESKDIPGFPTVETMALRVALIQEELEEFKIATAQRDMLGIADAIGDLLYVVYGAACAYGIDAQAVFNEIHRSNMTKLWPDGTVHHRDDGKVIKSPSYKPPNLKPFV